MQASLWQLRLSSRPRALFVFFSVCFFIRVVNNLEQKLPSGVAVPGLAASASLTYDFALERRILREAEVHRARLAAEAKGIVRAVIFFFF